MRSSPYFLEVLRLLMFLSAMFLSAMFLLSRGVYCINSVRSHSPHTYVAEGSPLVGLNPLSAEHPVPSLYSSHFVLCGNLSVVAYLVVIYR